MLHKHIKTLTVLTVIAALSTVYTFTLDYGIVKTLAAFAFAALFSVALFSAQQRITETLSTVVKPAAAIVFYALIGLLTLCALLYLFDALPSNFDRTTTAFDGLIVLGFGTSLVLCLYSALCAKTAVEQVVADRSA